MAIRTEQKLMQLEQEIKNLKATYKIYGGLVKSYLITGSWLVTNESSDFRIKFSPKYSTNQKTIISSIRYWFLHSGVSEVLGYYYIEAQDGSGNVVINFGDVFIAEGYTVQVEVVTMVDGTLTRII